MEDIFFKCIRFLTLKDLVSSIALVKTQHCISFLMQVKKCNFDKPGRGDTFSDELVFATELQVKCVSRTVCTKPPLAFASCFITSDY